MKPITIYTPPQWGEVRISIAMVGTIANGTSLLQSRLGSETTGETRPFHKLAPSVRPTARGDLSVIEIFRQLTVAADDYRNLWAVRGERRVHLGTDSTIAMAVPWGAS
jgi:hypothetical protein